MIKKSSTFLQAVFSPIVYGDSERVRTASLLYYLILTLMIGFLVISLIGMAIGSRRISAVSLGAFIIFIIPFRLLKNKQIFLSSFITVCTLMIIGLYSIYTGDGIHDVVMMMFPVVFLLSSLLLNRKASILLSFAALIGVSAVGIGEFTGRIHTTFSEMVTFADPVLVAGIALITIMIIHLLTGNLLSILNTAQQSEKNYKEIFNATSEAIFIFDRSGAIQDMNNSAAEMFGYSREQLQSLGSDIIFTDTSANPVVNPYEILRQETEKKLLFDWIGHRQNGEEFRVEVSIGSTSIGEMGCVLVVVRDIDERYRLEEMLHQSEKMSALGELASGITHDFRNQLAGIIGIASLLKQKVTDPKISKYIDMILQGGECAKNLTQQLLYFAHKPEAQPERVNVQSVMESIVQMISRSFDKKYKVTKEFSAPDSIILGDPGRLQNAVLNLAMNARDAMPDGGTIDFSVTETILDTESHHFKSDLLAEGRYVTLSVADSGSGIPEHLRAKIFEPFFTTKPRDKGTGMGLAAVYGTAKEYGGAIVVESEPGKGSVFRLFLPIL